MQAIGIERVPSHPLSPKYVLFPYSQHAVLPFADSRICHKFRNDNYVYRSSASGRPERLSGFICVPAVPYAETRETKDRWVSARLSPRKAFLFSDLPRQMHTPRT